VDGLSVPLRLLVADDVATVRRGIRALIDAEPDMRVVGEAATTTQALSLVGELGPDVVVTEVRGPALDGLELVRRVKQAQPAPGVVFLTQYQSPAYFFEALRCGCEGYILKSASPQEMLRGIRCVPLGHRYLDPAMARWLVGGFSPQFGRKPGSNDHGLSSRELQILELVARGHTNREIAGQLAVRVNTIRHHRARLMGKLGFHGTAELVKFALRQGLLEA
jgi:DNA-binding NarL/FixJ family response regulator